MKISILSLSICILVFSCGHTGTAGRAELKDDPENLRKIEAGDCIKRIIYKRHGTDIEKYDSLQTLYFHELEDYIDEDAVLIRKELDSIKRTVYLHGNTDEIITRIDSLKAELSPYRKYVVGYAFVHTFYDGKDTLTAIFVMDTLCGFGEMTLVKDILDLKDDPIDNTDYSQKVKKGK